MQTVVFTLKASTILHLINVFEIGVFWFGFGIGILLALIFAIVVE